MVRDKGIWNVFQRKCLPCYPYIKSFRSELSMNTGGPEKYWAVWTAPRASNPVASHCYSMVGVGMFNLTLTRNPLAHPCMPTLPIIQPTAPPASQWNQTIRTSQRSSPQLRTHARILRPPQQTPATKIFATLHPPSSSKLHVKYRKLRRRW